MLSTSVQDLTKQKSIFNEFIEEMKDRYDLIIADDINLIFEHDSINFENILKVVQTDFSLTPEVQFIVPLSTKRHLDIARNVLTHYDEVVSNFKRYSLIFNHVRNSFKNANREERIPGEVVDEFNVILKEGADNMSFYVTSFTKADRSYDVMVTVMCCGSNKKSTVDMCYTVVNPEGEKRNIHFFSVTKDDFAKDCTEHLMYGKLLHLSQEDLETKTTIF